MKRGQTRVVWLKWTLIVFISLIFNRSVARLSYRECLDVDPSQQKNATSLPEIRILTYLPCSDSNTTVFPAVACENIDKFPILSMALDEINTSPSILPNHKLVLEYVNSACKTDVSQVRVYENVVQQKHNFHAILGPACSRGTEAVAFVAGEMNLLQISYTASGPYLFNHTINPYFYSMQPLVFYYNDAYIALFKEYNWNRIAVIHQVDHLLSEAAADLVAKIRKEMKSTVILEASFSGDAAGVFNQLKDANARIIVALFYNSVANEFWCKARGMGLTGDEYVWIRVAWTGPVFDNTEFCGREEVKDAVYGALGTLGNDLNIQNDSNDVLMSGITVKQFYERRKCYEHTADKDNLPKADVTLKDGYVYDSLWALVLMLNNSIKELENRSMDIMDYRFGDNEKAKSFAEVFEKQLQLLNFTGISGPVMFNSSNGERIYPNVEVLQYSNNGTQSIVSIFETASRTIKDNRITFRGDRVPRDAPDPIYKYYSLEASLATAVIAGVGIILAIICILFALYFRKHKLFKRSTQRLNIVIGVGICIGLFSDVLYGMMAALFGRSLTLENMVALTVVCNFGRWFTHIGFIMAFGSLLLKTWRIYRIFCNPSLRKRNYLSDQYLIFVVLLMLGILIVYLSIWTGVSPSEWHEFEFINPENSSMIFKYYKCRESDLTRFIVFNCFFGLVYTLLLLFGLFMAIQINKNIQYFHRKYSDTPLVNVSAVLAFVFFPVGTILYWILEYEFIDFVILSTILRDAPWMLAMLCFIFLPMVYSLIKTKGKGYNFRKSSIASDSVMFGTRRFSHSSLQIPGFIGRRTSIASSTSTNSNKDDSDFKAAARRCSLEPVLEEQPQERRTRVVFSKPSKYDNRRRSLDDEVFLTDNTPPSTHSNCGPRPMTVEEKQQRTSILKRTASGNLLDKKHVQFTQ